MILNKNKKHNKGGNQFMFGSPYLLIEGKRMNMGEVTRLVDNISDNIILTGFNSKESLIGAIHVRCFNNRALKIRVLTRLLYIFTDNMEKESKITMFKDDLAAVNNVVSALEKIQIISEVMQLVVLCEDIEDDEEGLEILNESTEEDLPMEKDVMTDEELNNIEFGRS